MPLGLHHKEAYIEEGKRIGAYDANNNKKIAIVMGSSPEWEHDYYGLKKAFPDVEFDLFAVNRAVVYVEEVNHWCSRHPMCIIDAGWYQERIDKGWENGFICHSGSVPSDKHLHPFNHWGNHIDFLWRLNIVPGGSGLFATGVAMSMGYAGVIWCGIVLSRMYRGYVSHFKVFERCFKGFAKTNNATLQRRLGYPSILKNQWVYDKVK